MGRVVQELEPGLWWWTAPHPEWTTADVSAYALDDGERLVFFDPIATPETLTDRAAGRTPLVVLTNPWHARDAGELASQLGAEILTPELDVPALQPDRVAGTLYAPGEELPLGARAFSGREDPLDLVLWVEAYGALIIGDTLIDLGDGLELRDDWLPRGAQRGDVLALLRPLLDLPVKHVLPTHGAPTGRDALVRAIA